MSDFYLAVGDQVRFSKTVGDSDVYLFAGITGDLAPNHVDEEYMRGTAHGRRIAHGALLIGLTWTASTMTACATAGWRIRRPRCPSATTASASLRPCSSATPSP